MRNTDENVTIEFLRLCFLKQKILFILKIKGNPIKETEISKIYKHTKKTFGPKPKPVTNKITSFFRSPPPPVNKAPRIKIKLYF